jgi:hypothetical protein
MKNYKSVQRGRGANYIFGTIFVLFLAICFFLSKNIFFKIIGVLTGIGFLRGVYSFLKNYEWILEINNNILSWSYPRWPKSNGCIDLDSAEGIVVKESGKLIFRLKNGETKKIRMAAPGHAVHAYLEENFPNIELEYLDST